MPPRPPKYTVWDWLDAVTIMAGVVLLFVLIYSLAVLFFQLPG